VPRNRLLGRNFNAHDFFSLVAGKQRRSASKPPFCYCDPDQSQTRSQQGPRCAFPCLPSCAHTHVLASLLKKKKNVLAGLERGDFFYYYIYISSFKLLLEVRLDLPKQVCSVQPQRLPSVPRLGSQGSRLGKLGGARFPDGGLKLQRVAMLQSL